MITPRIHGVIDYLVGLLLILLPFVFEPLAQPIVREVTIGFGLFAVIYSLATDYPLGLFRLIPYPAHLGLDIVFAVALAASPWLFGFSDRIWWPHVAVGFAGLLVVLASWRGARPLP
jgi:hypothetical protein